MLTVPNVGATWIPDLWGQVRHTIEAATETAQATAADLENTRLLLQSELALFYFQLHGLDAEKQLLDSNVVAYGRALELTKNRYDQGVVSQVDVAQAQTQLEQTRAQATDTLVSRQQFEHAIAILIGKPPSQLTISPAPLTTNIPAIPGMIPSELLERRPDIAGNERRVAAANAQIGVTIAAYYPTLTLGASGGLQSSSLLSSVHLAKPLLVVGADFIGNHLRRRAPPGHQPSRRARPTIRRSRIIARACSRPFKTWRTIYPRCEFWSRNRANRPTPSAMLSGPCNSPTPSIRAGSRPTCR